MVEFILLSFQWDIKFIILVFWPFRWVRSCNLWVKQLIMCVYEPINIVNFTFRLWLVTIMHIFLECISQEVRFSICEYKGNPMQEHMWRDNLKTSKFLILLKWCLYFNLECIMTCMWQIMEEQYRYQFRKWIWKW